MRPADYAVIRYIPDPGRNEALNIGILLWNEQDYRLRIDDEAAARVVRENPWLERDALLYIEPLLHRQLLSVTPFSGRRVTEFLQRQKGFPILFTEPRFTTLSEDQPQPLDATLDRLIQRVVRPRRRRGGGGFDPVEVLAKQLRPLLRRRLIAQNYAFEDSRTGVPRTVHFFANSTANIALDALRLDLKRADEIRVRADAEAFKIEDIRARNSVRFIVYCDFSSAPELRDANANARRILESVRAAVVADPEEAAHEVEALVTAR